jgi:hypothetical protein
MIQPSLNFERLTGDDLKRNGMNSVLSHTPDAYKIAFVAAVARMPKGTKLTTEDVRAVAGDPPPEVHYNCMGGLMTRAARQGLIRRTNQMVKAKRPSLHSSLLSEWIRV